MSEFILTIVAYVNPSHSHRGSSTGVHRTFTHLRRLRAFYSDFSRYPHER